AGGPADESPRATGAEAVPMLDRHDATSFEIDQAEPLPVDGGPGSAGDAGDDGADGADSADSANSADSADSDHFADADYASGVVFDEHEGASEFVPTDPAIATDAADGRSTTSG
ncbi:MAG: hypothetical protein ABIQ53_02335, partial [Terracoccus sp.]